VSAPRGWPDGWRAPAAIAATAVLARAAVALALLPPEGLRRLEPSVIAANINAHRGFVFEQYGTIYYALKEPAHIWLLALLTRATGGADLAVFALQALCGIAAALATGVLAYRLSEDAWHATLAAALVAVNPFLVYYDSLLIHPLSLDTTLFVVTLLVNLWAIEDPGRRSSAAVVAGALTGLAIWQRSPLLFTGAATWAVAVLAIPGERRRQLARGALWLLVAVAVIQPWLARNYLHLGRWVYTTDTAHIIWLGNNPLSNGTYSDAAGNRIFYRADPAFRATIEGASELEQTDRFLAATREFVLAHPAWAASLAARRVWALVWMPSNAGAEYQPWQVGLYTVAYLLLATAGVAGAVVFMRVSTGPARRRALLAVSSLLGLVAVHALTAVNTKHRVPFEVLLAVFAAFLIRRAVR
jgi:hypothetical protein